MRRVGSFVVVVLLGVGACTSVPPPADPSGIPADEQAALDLADAPASLALELLSLADGTVFPWTFPSPDLYWDDRAEANTFRVRVRVPGVPGVVAEAVTTLRRVAFAKEPWERVRQAAGEGGAFDVELTAASVLPGGRVLRGPRTVVAHARFSGPGEHPQGHVTWGWKLRMPGASPGPVSADERGIRPLRVAMDGTVETILEDLPHMEEKRARYEARFAPPPPPPLRTDDPSMPGHPQPGPSGPPPGSPSSPDPGFGSGPNDLERSDSPAESFASHSVDFSRVRRRAGQPAWLSAPQPTQRACIACHTLSAGDKYLAATTQEAAAMPEGWVASQGTIYVIRLADGSVVHPLPGGVFPRFHPQDPELLMYAATSNSTGVKQRVGIWRADIHVLNLRTGEDRAVPGASDPERCEVFSDWSPDGRTIAVSRTAPGAPCEGTRGPMQLATVPWNDGAGGPATVLRGADEPGVWHVQPRFSPDGRWILYFRSTMGFFSSGGGDLWLVPAEGGEPRRLSLSTGAMESWHAFSPDGKWIAFASNRDRVDRPRGYVARFFEDGRVAAPLPLPGAGSADAHVHTLDWGP